LESTSVKHEADIQLHYSPVYHIQTRAWNLWLWIMNNREPILTIRIHATHRFGFI